MCAMNQVQLIKYLCLLHCAQVNVTAFSTRGVGRANTPGSTEWTETPNQKLARLTAAAAAGPAALPGPAADAAQRRSAATAQVNAHICT